MTREAVSRWLDSYEAAWRAPGTGALAELFAEGASYRQAPFVRPVVGLPAIGAMWERQRAGPDERFTMDAAIVAVDGDTAVARIDVDYADPPAEYRDLWVMRFDDAGRCAEFEEWPFFPGQPYAPPADG